MYVPVVGVFVTTPFVLTPQLAIDPSERSATPCEYPASTAVYVVFSGSAGTLHWPTSF